MTAPGRPIYLDYASTTPAHPRVRQAMEPYLQQRLDDRICRIHVPDPREEIQS